MPICCVFCRARAPALVLSDCWRPSRCFPRMLPRTSFTSSFETKLQFVGKCQRNRLVELWRLRMLAHDTL